MPRPSFPRTLPEFIRWFHDEDACFDYVVSCRWPDGFRCPGCGHDAAHRLRARRLLQCASCRRQTSATAGTVMHRSKLPLSKWLLAAYFVAIDKRGLSALQLQKQLGVGYEAAWAMLHKLRAAMVAPDRTRLAGTVEVDETYVGSRKRGRPDDEAPEKMLVIGAVEVRLNEESGRHYPGRARFRLIESRSADELVAFVGEVVEPGSTIVTDGLKEYGGVKVLGYRRSVEMARGGFKQKDVLKHFHTAAGNLKRWLEGTHHGAASKKHLQAYLNEYVFRLNRRGNQQAAFQRVLGIATSVRGPEIDQLYIEAGEPGGWEHPTGGRAERLQ
jgi:transposase-like protein